jgi:hypothetical protein
MNVIKLITIIIQAAATFNLAFSQMIPIFMRQKRECCVLCKWQCSVMAVKLGCEHWNIKLNEEKTQAVLFLQQA